MNLEYKATKFETVSDIVIPDIFYRRYKSGIDVIDELFGEGVLPGSSITMCAPAGCGKTTLLLQILEGLSANGYNVGYASGEENTYQLALDSFQALTTTKKMNSHALEKYAVSKLTRAAKDKECTVFFIMHLTKDGKLKGGTIVPHTVDVNMNIVIDGDIDDDARKIFFTKNRFGALNELTLFIGAHGYDFSAPVKIEESENKAPSKKGRKAKDLEAILNITEPPHLTADRVMTELGVEYNRAYNLLRELVLDGKIDKFGKGKSAIYKHKNLDNGGNVNGLLNAADSMKLFLKVAS